MCHLGTFLDYFIFGFGEHYLNVIY